ncbi:helix-turn-helix domain-containing protein [Thiohalomonas denitrificans]|uniref:Transcriptional regulator, contains XRE-family HTH domain n=1 Tax=Thiohalomonas denitrificans TaxID=415747 RepID=A0A1G5PMS7_9GAMM|nr:helix-turn-helix transcriptional regulator [Thiohalomonas denitrificans]SCZ50778.1 Transcriptional regulator, contains XRE-family HTH domain [Thiohalomonas denitrificans]
MGRKAVDLIDSAVGRRLRTVRNQHGLSLEKVGELLNVSPQQISRFERGQHRISASQLYRLARGFDVPVGWFFAGYREVDLEELQRIRLVVGEERGTWRPDSNEERENALLQAWRALDTDEQRKSVLDLLEAFTVATKRSRM